ncbi:MAG: hypothetical protein R3F43_01155 [bacterium]
MKRTLKSLFLSALVLGLAAPAFAQDDPEAELDNPGGGALLEDGLKERKAPEEPVLDDPDAALMKKVTETRAGLQQTINQLQETVQKMHEVEVELSKGMAKKFEGLDKRLERVTADLLKASDGFFEKHNKELDAYRAAVKDGVADAKDKTGKAVIKTREAYLKALDKVNKAARRWPATRRRWRRRPSPRRRLPPSPPRRSRRRPRKTKRAASPPTRSNGAFSLRWSRLGLAAPGVLRHDLARPQGPGRGGLIAALRSLWQPHGAGPRGGLALPRPPPGRRGGGRSSP